MSTAISPGISNSCVAMGLPTVRTSGSNLVASETHAIPSVVENRVNVDTAQPVSTRNQPSESIIFKQPPGFKELSERELLNFLVMGRRCGWQTTVRLPGIVGGQTNSEHVGFPGS